MKSSRLLGLFLVSLFLTACWLTSLPASEHPWDEDEVVTSDTTGTVQHNTGDDLGGNTRYIIIFPSDLSFQRFFGFGVLHLNGSDEIAIRKGGASQSPRIIPAQTGTTLPHGKVISATKK